MKKIKIEKLNNFHQDKFNSSKFYKLDFGIENIKKDQIELTTILATLSGFSGIDIVANKESIEITNYSINKAKRKSKELKINLNQEPLIFTSFSMKSFSKLEKNQIYKKIEFLQDLHIDVIDIHLNEFNNPYNIDQLDLIGSIFEDKIISINLSRKRLSNAHMIDLLKTFRSNLRKNFIIEVEGIKFYKNDFSQILQTISTADIINKQFKQESPKYNKIPIILGNVNDNKIEELAYECNVPFNGISINYPCVKNFLENKENLFKDNKYIELINEIKKNFLKN